MRSSLIVLLLCASATQADDQIPVAPMPRQVKFHPTVITPNGVIPGERYTVAVPSPKPSLSKPPTTDNATTQFFPGAPLIVPTSPNAGMVWVAPYYRKDGTFVKGYWRKK